MKSFANFIQLVALCAIVCSANAQDTVKITVDLANVTRDKVKINYTPAPISSSTGFYKIPTLIPGTYFQVNYGRFYKHIRAFDKDGKRLRTQRKGRNKLYIKDAGRLHHLEYRVKDSFDDKKVWDNILRCGGSNFSPGKNFVINHQLLYGYFEGQKNLPYELTFIKPKNFYGATALRGRRGTERDVFIAPDYFTVADSPILYAKPDTASMVIGGSKVHFACYAEQSDVTADATKRALEPVLKSLEGFFGEMPVEEYHFLMYYSGRKGLMNTFGQGALEHLHSSFYYLCETMADYFMIRILQQIGAHEFLHILVPLSMRSAQVDDFDFHEPDMSRHLWMYEGVTDYFTAKVLVHDSLITENDFRNNMFSAVRFNDRQPGVSMTESSRDIIVDRFFELPARLRELSNFYKKGKLAGLFLDIRLLELSGGEMSLRDVMLKLFEKYQPGSPFDDEKILDEIVSMTYPEIAQFMQNHVSGAKPMPCREYFDKIGWNYYPAGEQMNSFGSFKISYDGRERHWVVTKARQNGFGFKKGDVLVQVNSLPAVGRDFRDVLLSTVYYPETTQKAKLKVLRKGEELELSAVPDRSVKLKRPLLMNNGNATEKQKTLRQLLLTKY